MDLKLYHQNLDLLQYILTNKSSGNRSNRVVVAQSNQYTYLPILFVPHEID